MSETVARLESTVAQLEQSRSQPHKRLNDDSSEALDSTETNKQEIRSLSCAAVCQCVFIGFFKLMCKYTLSCTMHVCAFPLI